MPRRSRLEFERLLEEARSIIPRRMTPRERAEWGVYNCAIDRDWGPKRIAELIEITTLHAEIVDAEIVFYATYCQPEAGA